MCEFSFHVGRRSVAGILTVNQVKTRAFWHLNGNFHITLGCPTPCKRKYRFSRMLRHVMNTPSCASHSCCSQNNTREGLLTTRRQFHKHLTNYWCVKVYFLRPLCKYSYRKMYCVLCLVILERHDHTNFIKSNIFQV